MRLYVGQCNHCQERIYLAITAPSRDQLSEKIGHSFEIECPHCHSLSSCEVTDISAEPGPSSTPAGAILGGGGRINWWTAGDGRWCDTWNILGC